MITENPMTTIQPAGRIFPAPIQPPERTTPLPTEEQGGTTEDQIQRSNYKQALLTKK